MNPEKQDFLTRILTRGNGIPHIDCKLCSSCGGRCCKDGACGLMPVDIPDKTIKGIINQLRSGKFSITFFCLEIAEGIVEPIPVIAAREIDAGTVNKSIIHRPCALLRSNGCLLTEKDRPTQALLLIPQPNNRCKSLLKPKDVWNAWLPYRDLLEEIVKIETGKNSSQLFKEGCCEAVEHFRRRLAKVGGDFNKLKLTQAELRALNILNLTGHLYII